MTKDKLVGGTVHEIPGDLQEALLAVPHVRAVWESLTPLARNEWICWIISVKQSDARKKHLKRTVEELKEGKRRPCCWMGCIHRTDKAISPSVQWVLSKRAKSSNK